MGPALDHILKEPTQSSGTEPVSIDILGQVREVRKADQTIALVDADVTQNVFVGGESTASRRLWPDPLTNS